MNRSFKAKIVGPIAIVCALAGCGGSSSSTTGAKTVDSVRATIRAYLDDLRNGQGAAACDMLTEAAKAKAPGGPSSCPASVALARAFLGEKAITDYEATLGQLQVTITGDQATAPALTPGSTTRLVYTGGHWLIDSNA